MTSGARKYIWFIRFVTVAAFVSLLPAVIPAQYYEKGESPYVRCWELPLEQAPPFPAVVGDGIVFLAEQPGKIRAIDVITGKILWVNEIGGALASNLVYRNGKLFVVSNPSGTGALSDNGSILWTVDGMSGLALNSSKMPFSARSFLEATERSLILVGDGGLVTAVDLISQSVLWSRSFNSRLGPPPSASADQLVVGTEDGRLYLIDLDTGLTIFQRQWGRKIKALQSIGRGEFVVGDDRGNVARLGRVTSSVWNFKAGASVSRITLAGEDLAVTSLDNFLYLLSSDGGKVKWRKRLSGRALHTPVVLSDRIIAAAYGDNSIPISELRDGKTINKIEVEEGVYSTQAPQVTKEGAFLITIPGFMLAFDNKPCR